MDIVYIFRNEKILDDNMAAKEARNADQVILTIFVYLI